MSTSCEIFRSKQQEIPLQKLYENLYQLLNAKMCATISIEELSIYIASEFGLKGKEKKIQNLIQEHHNFLDELLQQLAKKINALGVNENGNLSNNIFDNRGIDSYILPYVKELRFDTETNREGIKYTEEADVNNELIIHNILKWINSIIGYDNFDINVLYNHIKSCIVNFDPNTELLANKILSLLEKYNLEELKKMGDMVKQKARYGRKTKNLDGDPKIEAGQNLNKIVLDAIMRS